MIMNLYLSARSLGISCVTCLCIYQHVCEGMCVSVSVLIEFPLITKILKREVKLAALMFHHLILCGSFENFHAKQMSNHLLFRYFFYFCSKNTASSIPL